MIKRDDSQRHPLATVVSPANLVSLSRLLLSPLLFWEVLEAEESIGTSWLAVLLGFILAASDILDGHLAR
ncbi:MAG TPA: CDP-alcohol phosphatidyltransferase family protein, partial [Acidimicrobiales bacterium]|nr:CDP-alcohol phosphatidyltransferase family protein [Acidimicrobiales bacterium]